jgi:apolipoprotein N-acyltransferase
MRILKSNPTHLGRSFFLIILFCLVPIFDNTVCAKSTAQNSAKKKGYVTIATLGSGPASVAGDAEPQQVVEQMIAHWKRQFAQVLPDRPDLIVVPEACDRPGGFDAEKLREYYKVRKDQVQQFFARTARENKCYIVYSAYRVMPDNTMRNSSILIDRKGNVAGIYNKNHPTI